MEQSYENLSRWVDFTADDVRPYLLFLLFAGGAGLALKTRFIQFRRLGDSFELIFAGFPRKKARGRP